MKDDPREFYKRANEGVQRMIAVPVGAPALTWHTMIWFGASESAGLSAVERFTRYVGNLGNRLREQSEQVAPSVSFEQYKPKVDGFIRILDSADWSLDIDVHEAERRGNRGTVSFFWMGLDTCIHFEIHIEYLTITTTIDLSIIEHKKTLYSSDFINDLDLFDQLSRKISETQNEPKIYYDNKSQYDRLYKKIYFSTWIDFSRDIAGHKRDFETMGLLLFDLRGFVTCDRLIGSRQNIIFARPFRQKKHVRNARHRNGQPPPPSGKVNIIDWARTHVRMGWPIVRQCGADSGAEYTASTLLDGRAIMISSMGSQPLDIIENMSNLNTGWESEDHQPVIYYLHSYTDDGFQVGRAIERLNHVGTFRLAAMVDFDRLRVAGNKLDQVEDKLSQGRRRLDRAIKMDQKGIFQRRNKLQNKALRSYSAAERRLSGISKRMSGGIDHRIQRALYYVGQFDVICDAMRIGSIEGYQPYRKYVIRRLGGAFRYMESLNRQITSVKDNMTALHQYFVAESLRKIAADIDKQDDAIGVVQRVGEGALFLALVPYYIGFSLYHTVGGGIEYIGEKNEKYEPPIYWWIGILLAYSYYIWRGFEDYKREWSHDNKIENLSKIKSIRIIPGFFKKRSYI